MAAYPQYTNGDQRSTLEGIGDVLARAGMMLHQLSDDAHGEASEKLAWLAAGLYTLAGELQTAAEEWPADPAAFFEALSRSSRKADTAERAAIHRFADRRS